MAGHAIRGKAISLAVALALFVAPAAVSTSLFEAPSLDATAPEAAPKAPAWDGFRQIPLRVSPEAVWPGETVTFEGAPGARLVIAGPEGARTSLVLDDAGRAARTFRAVGTYEVRELGGAGLAAFRVLGESGASDALRSQPRAVVLPDGSTFVRAVLDAADAPPVPPRVVTSLGRHVGLTTSHEGNNVVLTALVPAALGVPTHFEHLPTLDDAPLRLTPLRVPTPAADGLLPDGSVPTAAPDVAARLGALRLDGELAPAPVALADLLTALEFTDASPLVIRDRDGAKTALPHATRVLEFGKGAMWVPDASIARSLDASLLDLESLERSRAAAQVPTGWAPLILQLERPAAPLGAAVGDLLGATPVDGVLAVVDGLVAPSASPDALARTLTSLGLEARPLRLVNAVAVEAPLDALPFLAGLPGVERIALDVVGHATTDDSVDVVLGAPRADFLAANSDATGAGMKIAVLDTGVDATHPALDDLDDDGTTDDPKVVGWAVFTDEDCASPCDGNGHGTHVAATAAGTAAGSAYQGVAPNATIYGAKVIHDDDYALMSWIVEGIEWSIEQDVDVISMSLGFPDTSAQDIMEDAVDAATAAGVLVVVAAGNDGALGTIGSPASAASALTVGALNHNAEPDVVAGFSSRGPSDAGLAKPEILAPGQFITAAWPTALGGGYETISGTSMATPHVSGAAALFRELRADATPAEVKGTLVATARQIADDDGILATGGGSVNLSAALEACLLVTDGQLTVTSVPGTATFQVRNRCDTEQTPEFALTAPEGVVATLDAPTTVAASGGTGTITVTVTEAPALEVNAIEVAYTEGVLFAVVAPLAKITIDGPPVYILVLLDREAEEYVFADLYPAAGATFPPSVGAGTYELIAYDEYAAGILPGLVWQTVEIDSANPTVAFDSWVLADPANHVGFRASTVPLDSACSSEDFSFSPCTALRYAGDPREFTFYALGKTAPNRIVLESGQASWPDARVAVPGSLREMTVTMEDSDGKRWREAEVTVNVAGSGYTPWADFLVPDDGAVLAVSVEDPDSPLASFDVWSEDPEERYGPITATANGFFVPPPRAAAPSSVFDDDDVVAFDLAVPFTFFGTTHETIYVSSNGFLSFDDNYDDACCDGEPIPDEWSPHGIIAAGWQDLDPSDMGDVTVTRGQIDGTGATIVLWDVMAYSEPEYWTTAQVGLLDDGRILVAALEIGVPWYDTVSIGLENMTGTEGIQLLLEEREDVPTVLRDLAWMVTPRATLDPSAPLAGTCATGTPAYACEEIDYEWNLEIAPPVEIGDAIVLDAGQMFPYVQVRDNAMRIAPLPDGEGLRTGFVSGPRGGAMTDVDMWGQFWVGETLGSGELDVEIYDLTTSGGREFEVYVTGEAVDGAIPAPALLVGDLFEFAEFSEVVLDIWAGASPVAYVQVDYAIQQGWDSVVVWGERFPVTQLDGGGELWRAVMTLPPLPNNVNDVTIRLQGTDGAYQRIVLVPYEDDSDERGFDFELTRDAAGGCEPCIVTLTNPTTDWSHVEVEVVGWSNFDEEESYAYADTWDVGSVSPGGTFTMPLWLEMPAVTGPWTTVVNVWSGDEYGYDTLVTAPVLDAPTVTVGDGVATIATEDVGSCRGITAISLDDATVGTVWSTWCQPMTLAQPFAGSYLVQVLDDNGNDPVVSAPVVVDVPTGTGVSATSLAFGSRDLDGDLVGDVLTLDGTLSAAVPEYSYACITVGGHDSGSVAGGCSYVDGDSFRIGLGAFSPDEDVDAWGAVWSDDTVIALLRVEDGVVTTTTTEYPEFSIVADAYTTRDLDGDGAPGWVDVSLIVEPALPADVDAYLIASRFTWDAVEGSVVGPYLNGTLRATAVDGGVVFGFWRVDGKFGLDFLIADATGSESLGTFVAPRVGDNGLVYAAAAFNGEATDAGFDGETDSASFEMRMFGARGEVGASFDLVADEDGVVEIIRPLRDAELDGLVGDRSRWASLFSFGYGQACSSVVDRCVHAASGAAWSWSETRGTTRAAIEHASFTDHDADGKAEALRVHASVESQLDQWMVWCVVWGEELDAFGDMRLLGCTESEVRDGHDRIAALFTFDEDLVATGLEDASLYLIAVDYADWPVASEPWTFPPGTFDDLTLESALEVAVGDFTPRDLDGDGTNDTLDVDVHLTASLPMVASIEGYVEASDAAFGGWVSSAWDLVPLSPSATATTHTLTFFAGDATADGTDLYIELWAEPVIEGAYANGHFADATASGLAAFEMLGAFAAQVEGFNGHGVASETPSVGRVTLTTGLPEGVFAYTYAYFDYTARVIAPEQEGYGDTFVLDLPGEWWVDGGGDVEMVSYVCFQDACAYLSDLLTVPALESATDLVTDGAWAATVHDTNGDGNADTVSAGGNYAIDGSLPVAVCAMAERHDWGATTRCEPFHAANEPGWGDIGPTFLAPLASGDVWVDGFVSVCADAACSAASHVALDSVSANVDGSESVLTLGEPTFETYDLDGSGAPDAALVTIPVELGGARGAVVCTDFECVEVDVDAPTAVVRSVVTHDDTYYYVEGFVWDDITTSWVEEGGYYELPLEALPFFSLDSAEMQWIDFDGDGIDDHFSIAAPGVLAPGFGWGQVYAAVFGGDHWGEGSRPLAPGDEVSVVAPMVTTGSTPYLTVFWEAELCFAIDDLDVYCEYDYVYDEFDGFHSFEKGVELDLDLQAVDLVGGPEFDQLTTTLAWSSMRGGDAEAICLWGFVDVCMGYDGDEDDDFEDFEVADHDDESAYPGFFGSGLEVNHTILDRGVYVYTELVSAEVILTLPDGTSTWLFMDSAFVVDPLQWDDGGAAPRVVASEARSLGGTDAADAVEIDVDLGAFDYVFAYSDYGSWEQAEVCPTAFGQWTASGPVTVPLAPYTADGCAASHARFELFGFGAVTTGRVLPDGEEFALDSDYWSTTVTVPIDGAESLVSTSNAAFASTNGWAAAQVDVVTSSAMDVAFVGYGSDDDTFWSLHNTTEQLDGARTLRLDGPVLSDEAELMLFLTLHSDAGAGYGYADVGQFAVASPGSVSATLAVVDGAPVATIASTAVGAYAESSGLICAELTRLRSSSAVDACDAVTTSDAGSLGSVAFDAGDARALVGDGSSKLWFNVESQLLARTTGGTWAYVNSATDDRVPVTLDGSAITLPWWADAYEGTVAYTLPAGIPAFGNFHGYADLDAFEAPADGVFLVCADRPSQELVLENATTIFRGAPCIEVDVAAGDDLTVRAADPWAYGPAANYRAAMLLDVEGTLTAALGAASTTATFGVAYGCEAGYEACDAVAAPPAFGAPGLAFVVDGLELRASYLSPLDPFEWRGFVDVPSAGTVTLSWAGVPADLADDLEIVLWNGVASGLDAEAAQLVVESVPAGRHEFAIRPSAFVETVDLCLAQGWNLVGVSVRLADPLKEATFGELAMFEWITDPLPQYDPVEAGESLVAGKAYWVNVPASAVATPGACGAGLLAVQMIGAPMVGDVALTQAWNLVAAPHPHGVHLGGRSDVVPVAFEWDTAAGRYRTTDFLTPFDGAWLYANEATTLLGGN